MRLVPGHFAERHGLIVLVALGESIVAIGIGAEAGVDGGVIAAAVVGIAVACASWWLYFDVSTLAAAHRLSSVETIEERNALARDAFSFLHLPFVAAIVLVALGMKITLARVGDPLGWCRARRSSAATRCTCSPTSRSHGGRSARSAGNGSSPRW